MIKPLKTDTVTTLKPAFKWRPIIAINHLQAMTEDGEVLSHNEYIARLPEFASAYIFTFGATPVLLWLHRYWHNHPQWQWRLNETTVTGFQRISVSYYGCRRPNGHAESRFQYVTDYSTFTRTTDTVPTLPEMVKLAQELRDFCCEMGIRIKGTAAGTFAQFLRHPDFYPQPRRRIPDFINEAARTHLPGNHYALYADPVQRIEAATYIDQSAAHHHAAATTPLPNANSLTCQGYDRIEDVVYAHKHDRSDSLFTHAMQQHGLLKLKIRIPRRISSNALAYTPHRVQSAGYGTHTMFLWSNEIPYLESLGIEIEAIYALWGTDEIDTGLPAYARFAMDVQDRYPWLKTALLTVYGTLALRQSPLRIHYHQGTGSKDNVILGTDQVASRAVTIQPQSLTTNVIQRGLIEAHVRALSLDMARQCNAKDIEVISIYADGIFLRAPPGTQLPLDGNWRQKGEVNDLEFECATRFRSRQLTRLPGTPRFKRDYHEVKPNGNV